ncbi:zinc-finger domain-containing protein [Apodospora peruviana]|uniref:Zinc-finger domain-containing protein n=1 Tax=Apodospora peruviana TaxID=516989 RepID=A0AAE0HV58_9PEZI|nr:zinc-finger domain-containing protein [Apodospora peruviana]
MYTSRLRAAQRLSRQCASLQRSFTTTGRQLESPTTPVPAANKTQTTPLTAEGEAPVEIHQAPNRSEIWSRSQRPRSQAMTGPRFEQTDFSLQPQPYSAMELIHKEPVRWTHARMVSCDGGGGPAGHPRIFINTDKPEIATCGYCGVPFVCFFPYHGRKLEDGLLIICIGKRTSPQAPRIVTRNVISSGLIRSLRAGGFMAGMGVTATKV